MATRVTSHAGTGAVPFDMRSFRRAQNARKSQPPGKIAKTSVPTHRKSRPAGAKVSSDSATIPSKLTPLQIAEVVKIRFTC